MDQNYSNNQNDFLWTLLANPTGDAHLYTINLQRLVNDFPQSGILQAMLAHASDDKNLKQASVYFNPKSLYKLINSPSSFIGVSDEKIIYQSNILGNGHSVFNGAPPVFTEPGPQQLLDVAPPAGENYFSENPVVDTEPGNHLHIADQQQETEHENTLHLTDTVVNEPPPVALRPEIPETAPAETPSQPPYVTLNEVLAARLSEDAPAEKPLQPHYTTLNESLAAQSSETSETARAEHVAPGVIEVIAPVIAETVHKHEDVQPVAEINTHNEAALHSIEHPVTDPAETKVNHVEAFPIDHVEPEHVAAHYGEGPYRQIDEEVFDEITGIDEISVSPQSDTVAPEPEPIKAPEEPRIGPVVTGESDQLIVDNIAATDYFAFNRAFRGHKRAGPVENITPAPPPPVEAAPEKAAPAPANEQENQDVSKYHDEKMPYSFMWWLDKTRKEHAAIYQPYVKEETGIAKSKTKATGDELQQQYYENIFHITSFDDLNKNNGPRPAPFVVKRKEQVIIERFIKEEPQIRPQSSDKLDNENKAKKSSEDRDEMVTETLAAIYSDQMLYHKAIASYKKLMLKFPEKSRYFASKIEQLEKKTN